MSNQFINAVNSKDGKTPVQDGVLGEVDRIRGVNAYITTVASLAAQKIGRDDILVCFTNNLDEIPSVGNNVVVFIVGNESTRYPKYAPNVLAVFKCFRFKPWLGCNPLWKPSLIKWLFLCQWFIRMARWVQSTLKVGIKESRGRLICDLIPVGYNSPPEAGYVKITDRPLDVFYAGSIGNHVGAAKGLRSIMPDPKELLRKEMVRAVKRMQAVHAGIRCKIITADCFVPLGIEWGFIQKSDVLTPAEYSRSLKEAKICLVPRGTSPETFRLFEASCAGCVVISDRLPGDWYYRGCPAIFVDSWDEIEGLIPALLADQERLLKLQQATMDWWKSRCAEDVVAEHVASRVKAGN